jgi:MFS family permease
LNILLRGGSLKSNSAKNQRALMIYNFFSRATMNIGMSYNGVYAAEVIGLKSDEFGIVGAISTILTQLTQPIWGRISDKKNVRKYFIAIGELGAGIIIALTFTLKSFPQYLLASAILWIMWSGAYTCLQALLGDITVKSGRGSMIGSMEFVGGMGAIVAVTIVGSLIDAYGYISALITSVVCTAIAVIPILTIRENVESEVGGEKTSWKMDVTRDYKMYLALSTIWWGVMSISWPLFSLMQVKVFNLSKTEIAIISVAGSFGQMIMMPVWGKLADRYGRRKLIVLACASTSIWSLAYAISQNYIQLLILNTIGSVLGSSINIIPWIYLLDVTPKKRSRATLIALYNTVTGFSQAIGQYVGGEIAIQIGLRETMMLNSAMRLIFAIPMLILRETLTRRQ